jgi:hypothetical protein
MRYTGFAVVLVGVMIACFAGYQYASGGPPDQEHNPSILQLVLPLVFAVLLVIVGTSMWLFGGKGYTLSRGMLICRPASAAETGAGSQTGPGVPIGRAAAPSSWSRTNTAYQGR